MISDQFHLAALCVLLLAGAWLDVTRRQLPNLLCLAILASGVVNALVVGDTEELLWRLVHSVAALIAGMFLFRLGALGGGDAKFYAAAAAWFPLSQAMQLLLYVSLSGIILLTVWALCRRFGSARGWKLSGFTSDGVPYGVAIALGAIALGAFATKLVPISESVLSL